MKYSTCHDAYQHGVSSRLVYPLHSGLYKLAESKDRINRTGEEIVRISEVVNNRRHPAAMMHCTFEDRAVWLRDVPFEIAYRMGYEIVPGFRALEPDGVNRIQAESAARSLESVMDQHLGCWDRLRNSYSRKIADEYDRMRNGQSNALRVVDEARVLIDLAVSKLPVNIQKKCKTCDGSRASERNAQDAPERGAIKV